MSTIYPAILAIGEVEHIGELMSEIHYLALIHKLEQQKWDYIAKYGQAGIKYWPPIDAKLDKLYKWYVKDYTEGRVHVAQPTRIIKRENLV